MTYCQNAEPERIIAAAMRDTRGVIWSADPPARHFHLIRMMDEYYRDRLTPHDVTDQGFITSHGFYVERERARAIAEERSQLLPTAIRSSSLFSEDVW